MNEITVFSYNASQIRTIMIDNEPWFVAKDVCEYFGDTHYRRSVSRIADDVKGVSQIDTPGGKQDMIIVSEPGLYMLLFNMEPQKGTSLSDEMIQARINKINSFRRWVTSDVLPAIRKTGSFSLAKVAITSDFLQQVTDQLKEQERQIKELKPKADFFDAVANSKSAVQIGDVAKLLAIPGIGRNNLFQILRDNHILMKDNVPYQQYVDNGYFRVIEQKYNTPEGETRISIKTLVYQKGIDFIRKVITRNHNELSGNAIRLIDNALQPTQGMNQ